MGSCVGASWILQVRYGCWLAVGLATVVQSLVLTRGSGVAVGVGGLVGPFEGPARKCGIEGCWHRLADHVISSPRASKLAGLVKPWAVRRSTWSRLFVLIWRGWRGCGWELGFHVGDMSLTGVGMRFWRWWPSCWARCSRRWWLSALSLVISSRAASSRCCSDSVDPRSGGGMGAAWVVVIWRSRLISARRSGWR